MCEYCDMTLVNIEHSCKEYYIHKPFLIRDEHSQKRIKAYSNYPIMYLREYKFVGIWSIVCEFADKEGNAIEMYVIHCPRCGRKLSGTNNKI